MQEQVTKLLIIEDDPGLQRQLRWSFGDCDVAVASDRDSALEELERFEPTVVTLDLGLLPDPGGTSEGFRVLGDILSRAPNAKIIVVTGHDDRNNAVRAIGIGAYDFYEKPVDPDVLSLVVERAARLARLEREHQDLAAGVMRESPFGALLAVSPQMMKVCRTVEKLAPTDVTTLVLGESGTGKEVLVRILHELSNRSSKRLVAINCAAIPENCSRANCSGTRRAPLPAPYRRRAASLRRRTAARCSWTKSVTCRCSCSPSSCVFSRSESSSASGAQGDPCGRAGDL